jgi:hypothetical protein
MTMRVVIKMERKNVNRKYGNGNGFFLVEAQRETEQCFLSENASQEVCRFI